MKSENNVYTVSVEMNQEYIKNELARLIEENTRAEMLFIDLDELARITCMEGSYLTRTLLKDPRVLQYQRRRGQGKRYWLYKPTVETILDIVTNEWEV